MRAVELAEPRKAILDRWVESVFAGYPEETAKFLRKQSDRFANPVGMSLKEALADLLDGVLDRVDPAELEEALDRVIRVRAVQDFSARDAVGFVFDLKPLLRSGLEAVPAGSRPSTTEIEASVDSLGLLAFDVYMRCREQVWAIRNAEVKNLSVGIMERVAEWREKKRAPDGGTQCG